MEFYTPVLFISMTPKLALEEGLRYDKRVEQTSTGPVALAQFKEV